MPSNTFSTKRNLSFVICRQIYKLTCLYLIPSYLRAFAGYINALILFFFFFQPTHSCSNFVKCLSCVLNHAFCIASASPLSGTHQSCICWLSVTFQGVTWKGKEIHLAVHDSMHFLLPFNLPGFDFPFCQWYLQAGCCLHHFVEWQIYEAAAAMLEFVAEWNLKLFKSRYVLGW